jgi:hypothetical protein
LNRWHLRFARARSYIAIMDDRTYWTAQLREAEAELDAATRRADINAAAKKVMLAKAELKRLDQKLTRRPGAAARAASS